MSSADPEWTERKGKTNTPKSSKKGEVHFGFASRQNSGKFFDSPENMNVVDLREEIASMNAQTGPQNRGVNKASKLSQFQSRPNSPFLNRPSGRRQHTSAIAPSSASIDFDTGALGNKNMLDIWAKSLPFFGKVPSDADIDQLFAVPEPPQRDSVKKTENWYQTLQKYVEITRRATSCTLEDLPNQKAKSDSTAVYWRNENPTFQVEDCIKKNKTQLHTLLSALVKEDPIPQETKPKGKRKQRSLIPELNSGGYMSLPFEERLEIELESCGMGDIDDGENDSNDRPFVNDMNVLKTHIDSMRPVVEDFHNEIKEKLPEIRKEDEERMNMMAEYHRLMQIRKKNPPHKKPGL